MNKLLVAITVILAVFVSSPVVAFDMSNVDARVRFGQVIEGWHASSFDFFVEADGFTSDYQTMNFKLGAMMHLDSRSRLIVMMGQQLGAGVSNNNIVLSARWLQWLGGGVDFRAEADLVIPIDVQNDTYEENTLGFRFTESIDFEIRRRIWLSLRAEQENFAGIRMRFGPAFTWNHMRVSAGYLYQSPEYEGAPAEYTEGYGNCPECDCGDMVYVSTAFSF